MLQIKDEHCVGSPPRCTDAYGADFLPGDVVVQGEYLTRTKEENHLQFRKDARRGKVAIAHAHSVRKVGVVMTAVERIHVPTATEDSEDDLDDIPMAQLRTELFELSTAEHDDICDAVMTHR